jgi:transcriptional regulator with XRE-family HTH domain
MPKSFGARLRQQREESRIALETIAEQTKIKQSLLEGLERDDVSRWPGGIFRRAYLRAYAQAIGLDPDVILREFLQLHPDPAEVEATVPMSEPGVDRERSARPPMRLRYVVESAIGSLSWRRVEAARPSGAVHDARVRTGDAAPAGGPAPVEPDFTAAANLCTAFGKMTAADDVAPLLRDAAAILGAIGLIVWIWDPRATRLRPALAHGYSDRVLAHVPALERDADNATAAAYRLAQPCVVEGRNLESGALVVPLMTAAGCAGVLAIELPQGSEQTASVRALAIIFAAQLARVFGAAGWIDAADRRLA